MVIVWRGRGYLVALIVFGISLAAEVLVERLFADDRYYQVHGWPLAGALFAAGLAVWALGNRIAEDETRTTVDPQTGREVVVRGTRHTLFWIEMRWWGPILIALAGLVLLLREP